MRWAKRRWFAGGHSLTVYMGGADYPFMLSSIDINTCPQIWARLETHGLKGVYCRRHGVEDSLSTFDVPCQVPVYLDP